MKNANTDILNLALVECNAIKDNMFVFDDETMMVFTQKIMAQCAIACTDSACNTLESPEELIAQHFGM
jgi:hypothetical protein